MSINRRTLLSGLAVLSAGAVLPRLDWSNRSSTELRINADRLRKSLEGLSVYGRPAGGTFADGVSRTGFSDAVVGGRNYVMQLMREAGMEPRIDAAGNIFGLRTGSDHNLKPILFGSHIDSVPSGGNFDGDVGSMSAIEVMRTLNESNIPTRHPLQMAIWTDEENTFAGSGSAAGLFRPSELERVRDGMSLADGLRKLGGDPTRLAEARLAPGAIRCYLELHIEQGATLYKANVPIGVVEGIVAIDRCDVEIRGFANHAGTTPMKERHNALLAAAKLIETVQNVVTQEPGRQVGTVGKLEVFPNAVNVIPGLVKHSIELRDLSADKIARLGDEIQKRGQDIAKETGTEIIMAKTEHDAPAAADPEVQAKVEAAAAGLGLKTMRLPSGAGQDAQMLAKVGSMGMIFVPSVDGISHSPKEFTRWEDCANGANVLLHTILLIDRGA
jgi:N-carbamoyl-L-amino-acid hydrolase